MTTFIQTEKETAADGKIAPPDRGSILIVDDDEVNLEMLSRRLKRAGYSVAVCDRGKRALEWVQHNRVDLLLLDIQMPEMNGMEVLEALRREYSPTKLPVIMVTAKSESSDIVAALEIGASDYITKPVDLPVCLARISAQMQIGRSETSLQKSEERYALAARGANDGLWDWDLTNDEIYFSTRWKEMLGWSEEEIGNRPEDWFGRVHPEDLDHLRGEISAHLDGLVPHCENEYRIRHRDGTYRWMLGRGIAIRDGAGTAYRMAGSQTDITRGKVVDALTGLPNRILFMDRVGRMLERARRHQGYKFAVLFLDLDDFKRVNESLGHAVGDQLLVAVANRLEASLRAADTVARLGKSNTVARLGGDEFTILLDDIKCPENAVRVAERVGFELTRAVDVGGQEIFTSASMGIVISASGYNRAEDCLRDADTAMYRAKTQGRGRFEIFDTEMRASAVSRLQLETELRRAVERKEFTNYYHVIVSLETGCIKGFESLIRWQHPSRGLVSPAEFIAVAEETGLIIPLTDWILREACLKMRNWQTRFPLLQPLTISVNICSKHFLMPNLVPQCRRILQDTGLSPEALCLEITESTVMPDPDRAIQIMLQLKELGIKLEIDDFGTGYSSLSYLQRFPLDALKIDRSFISRIGKEDEKAEIARTVIALAQNLGLNVVAEGVETAEQLAVLRSLGCSHAQGYYFSHPLSAEAAVDLIAADPRW